MKKPMEKMFDDWNIHDLHCAMIGNMVANKKLFDELPISTQKEIDDLAENMALIILYANDVLLHLNKDPAEEVEKCILKNFEEKSDD